MTVTTEGPAAGSPASGPDPSGDEASHSPTNVPKILVGLVGMIATGYVMWTVFLSFALFPEIYLDSKLLIGIVAVVGGRRRCRRPVLLPQHVRRGTAARSSRPG